MKKISKKKSLKKHTYRIRILGKVYILKEYDLEGRKWHSKKQGKHLDSELTDFQNDKNSI